MKEDGKFWWEEVWKVWGEKLKTYFVEKYESREKEGLRHKGKTYVKSIKHKTKKNSLHFKHLTATEDSISYENTWPAIVCGAGNTSSTGQGIILKISGQK